MGWMDTSVYGSQFYQTPNTDRLASQGMRFTQAYAACPVCSPTRASILTGKYPARLHLTDWIPGHKKPWARLRVPDWTMRLEPSEVTIAEALKPAGYTTGCIGKWHLGNAPEFLPDKQGFDFAKVLPTKTENDPKSAATITNLALQFLDNNKDKPFFLYVAHHAVHLPIEAPKETIAKYEALKKPGLAQSNAAYAAMVDLTDACVGKVLQRLDELRLADHTVVIFMSDNGGLARGKDKNQPTSNLPLREGKGTLYEGGVREPLIVRWPGAVKPGSTCATPVISVDFYPTILEIAGLAKAPDQILDGLSLVPLLKGGATLKRDALYWHYPHYHVEKPAGAVRAGDFKLIEYFEDGRLELYNVKDDIGEKNNLAAAMPDKAKELRAMLENWRQSVGAQMPTPNPNYDPARANQGPEKKKGKSAPSEE